ncbi:MAG: DUF3263 domain-containing protein [Mobilicoccus sp.]|nr:DUF3263 domain-containing protein [Mobilicoccus sp.]
MRRPNRRPALSTRDLTVLEIERRWGPSPSCLDLKLEEAWDRLRLDARAYAMVLNSLMEDPVAAAADRRTIERLRAQRDQRRADRGL